MECFTVFILGLVAFFVLMAGALAFGLFGLGAIVYGLGILSQRPIAGSVWLVIGFLILSAFAGSNRR